MGIGDQLRFRCPDFPHLQLAADGGHSILCLIENHFDYQAKELWKSLCPVPVKHVLRSHRIHGGFAVVEAKYDSEIGLQTNPEDDEF